MVSHSPTSSPDTFAPTPELWLGESTQSGDSNVKLHKPIAKKVTHNRRVEIGEADQIMSLARTCQGSRMLQEEIMKSSILNDMRYVL